MKPNDEYIALRQEVTARALLLHQLLGLLTILEMLIVIISFYFINQRQWSLVYTLLLASPIVLAGLTFNYQANQMTLEAVANYSALLVEPDSKTIAWDTTYGKIKRNYQLISFLKIWPIIVLHLSPLLLIIGSPSVFKSPINLVLFVCNVVVGLLVLFNFRYKIERK